MDIKANKLINNLKSIRRKAFTLAEVMITIAIIGLIYAFGITPLVNSIQNAGFTAKLTKESSIIAQALNNYQADGNSIASAFPTTDPDWGSYSLSKLAPYLSIIKNCGSGMGCIPASTQYTLKGAVNDAYPDTTRNGMWGKAILADGTMLWIWDNESNCTTIANGTGTGPLANNTCGTIGIDLNGDKGPNKLGRDVFAFWITKTGIYPMGSYNDGYNDCNTAADGNGCAYKVLTQGMTY